MRVLEFTELDAWQARKLGIKLDTRQPGTVFKTLDTWQSEILTNFLGIAPLIPLRTQDICLEISSDCPRRDFAQKAKSRGGTLVTRAYIKENTYS